MALWRAARSGKIRGKIAWERGLAGAWASTLLFLRCGAVRCGGVGSEICAPEAQVCGTAVERFGYWRGVHWRDGRIMYWQACGR